MACNNLESQGRIAWASASFVVLCQVYLNAVEIFLAFSDGISAEEVRRVSKVHVRAVGRGRLKGLTEEASTEFFERSKREAF